MSRGAWIALIGLPVIAVTSFLGGTRVEYELHQNDQPEIVYPEYKHCAPSATFEATMKKNDFRLLYSDQSKEGETLEHWVRVDPQVEMVLAEVNDKLCVREVH